MIVVKIRKTFANYNTPIYDLGISYDIRKPYDLYLGTRFISVYDKYVQKSNQDN